MNLARILSVLKSEPLLCNAGYRFTLLDLFSEHASMDRKEFRSKRDGQAKSGQELCVEQMELMGNCAVIPVGGPIGQGLGAFERGAGAVDTDDIRKEIGEAETDDDVENIILNFDTPGGMVTGTPELGQFITEVQKPIYAFTRGQMCSAGYWLASSCDGIFATPSSDVGCIGVCCSFMDLSKMADMAGIKVKVFGSGDYKGMGTPGTSLTAQQEMLLQARVMDLASMFYGHVESQRGQIKPGDMQGQTFKGQAALDVGLIDDVMPDLDALISFLN